MDITGLVEMNGNPQRFNVHAQTKLTQEASDEVDEFARQRGIKRSTALRVLIDIGLAEVKTSES